MRTAKKTRQDRRTRKRTTKGIKADEEEEVNEGCE